MTKIAMVTIDGNYTSKGYNFQTSDTLLEEGDKVVVDTANGLLVGTFQGYTEDAVKATKWLIQKINLIEHLERVEKENKLKELKKKMDARRKKVEELEIYEILAGKDSDMAELLADYKAIKGAS